MAGQRPVVTGVDASAGAAAAVRWAIDEARARSAPLRLVCAFDSDVSLEWAWQAEYEILEYRTRADQIIAQSLAEAESLASDLEVSGEVLFNHPTHALVRESESAALLVVGSRPLPPWRRVLGSVSSAVAGRAHCPVVVVRGAESGGGEAAARRPVIVGVDGTEHSRHVLGYAFEYVARKQLPLRVLLCWHPHPLARTFRLDYATPAELRRASDRLEQLISPWSGEYPDVEADRAVLDRHPIEALVEEAEEADLLIVGARGRRALGGTLLGSVSQGVLHHATCTVAVIHHPPAAA